ncbi:uncharacterized protein WM294_003179 [Sarcoramphus papa]
MTEGAISSCSSSVSQIFLKPSSELRCLLNLTPLDFPFRIPMKNFQLMPGCNTVIAPAPENRERGWRARRTPCCSFLWPPGVILGADFGQPGSTTMAAALEASQDGTQRPVSSSLTYRTPRAYHRLPIWTSC